MELGGLAVGAVALVGLFSTCLELVEKFDNYKNFRTDSHRLTVQFEADRLRFEKWGRAVGFQQDRDFQSLPSTFDDPKTYLTIRNILSAIRHILDDADDTYPPAHPGADSSAVGQKRFSKKNVRPHQSRIKWALIDRPRRITQVNEFGKLVQTLYDCVSPNGAGNMHIGQKKLIGNDGMQRKHHHEADYLIKMLIDDSLDTNSLIAEFQRMLAKMQSDIQGCLSYTNVELLELIKKAETRRDLLKWVLGNSDLNEQYQNAIEKRLHGTCDWILERPVFRDWVSKEFSTGTAKLLWINGPAGFGKTVLCARIVEHLSCTLQSPLAHFFFSSDFSNHGDPYVTMRSWIAQILSHPRAFEIAYERWEAQYEQTATRASVVKIFGEISLAIPQCTFVLDGLDEYTWLEENQKYRYPHSIADFLETLILAVENTSTRIMIVSRNESQIRRGLSSHPWESLFEYNISIQDIQSDTAAYSRSIVGRKLSKKPEMMRDSLSQRMADRCKGQFLWLKMQEDELESWMSRRRLEEAIDKIPAGLEHLYDRYLSRVSNFPSWKRDRAIALLRWAAFALRPLTVSEATEAILIQDDCYEFSTEELPDTIDEDYINYGIVGLCGCLLEVRSTSTDAYPGFKTIHLTHFTIKEYLLVQLSTRQGVLIPNESLAKSAEVAQSSILAKLCLCYINLPSVWQITHAGTTDRIHGAFRDYASHYWYRHAALGDPQSLEITRLVNRLFKPGNKTWESWRNQFDSQNEELCDSITDDDDAISNRLYYASLLRLTETLKYLIQEDKQGTIKRKALGSRALAAACTNGSLMAVRELIQAGVGVTNMGMSPLHFASQHGHSEIVELLLHSEIGTAITDDQSWTPLHDASCFGYAGVVRVLLQNNANVEATTNRGCTPIYLASSRGHVEVVKLLLEIADITTPDSKGWTPLHAASAGGYVEVTKLLLQSNVDTTVATNQAWTSLHLAAANGHAQVVQLLLETANITAPGSEGWTPLIAASENGNAEVVKLLLEHNADISACTHSELNSLMAASSEGHIEVVKILLIYEADISAINYLGWTSLMFASSGGHVEVVKLLLRHGADPKSVANDGMTSLDLAIENSHLEVAKVLLLRSDRISLLGGPYGTSLGGFAFRGWTDLLKILYEHRHVDRKIVDNHGRNPLHLAARGGHPDTYDYLNTLNLDPYFHDQKGESLIHYASSGGSLPIVHAIFERGLVSLSQTGHWTPLHWACKAGSAPVVERLVKEGYHSEQIILDRPEGKWSPISMAVFHGNGKMLEELTTSCKSILGGETDGVQVQGRSHGNFCWCDGCFHHIYGPRFRCRTCQDFDYCFMCKPFLQHLHDGHDWECIEPPILN